VSLTEKHIVLDYCPSGLNTNPPLTSGLPVLQHIINLLSNMDHHREEELTQQARNLLALFDEVDRQEELEREEELTMQERGVRWGITIERVGPGFRAALVWVGEADETVIEPIQAPVQQALDALSRVVAEEDEAAQDAAGGHQVGDDGDDNNDDSDPEFFWPNIQKYIENPAAGQKPSIKCGICLQGLFHPGMCFSSSRHHREPLEVLNCGHVIGRRCWGNVVVTAIRGGNQPACPLCREKQRTWFWRFDIGEAGVWQRTDR